MEETRYRQKSTRMRLRSVHHKSASSVTILLPLLLLFPFIAQSATLSVPGDYSAIQAAINVASSGDTIEVTAGTYAENLSISKQLTLIGRKADGTTDAWTNSQAGVCSR